jgi:hypothetical protein
MAFIFRIAQVELSTVVTCHFFAMKKSQTQQVPKNDEISLAAAS